MHRVSDLRRSLDQSLAALVELGGEVPTSRLVPAADFVCLAGELKAGKSKLLNVLLGIRTLPDQAAVSNTRVPARLVSSPNHYCATVSRTGETNVVTLESARRIVSAVEAPTLDVSDIDRVEFGAPHPLLTEFGLEDTPGIADASRRSGEQVAELLDRAEVALGVIYLCSGLLMDSDVAVLRALHDRAVPTHLVFSRFDLLEDTAEPGENVKDICRASVHRWELDFLQQRILFVSARRHEQGDEEGSGVGSLQQVLRDQAAGATQLRLARDARMLAREATAAARIAAGYAKSEELEGANGTGAEEYDDARESRSLGRILEESERQLFEAVTIATDRLVEQVMKCVFEDASSAQEALETTLLVAFHSELAQAARAGETALAVFPRESDSPSVGLYIGNVQGITLPAPPTSAIPPEILSQMPIELGKAAEEIERLLQEERLRAHATECASIIRRAVSGVRDDLCRQFQDRAADRLEALHDTQFAAREQARVDTAQRARELRRHEKDLLRIAVDARFEARRHG